MSDQKIQLTVQVNAETGQLEVLGNKMRDVGQTAGNAFKSFLPAATGASILAFFTSAVKGAEEQNESLQRLKFTLEANGVSWAKNSQSINDWSQAIGRATRFSDGDALASLDKLARATGNVTQAQKASELAMGLAAKTGKSLGETTDFVSNLINKNARAVLEAHKEYGTFVGNAQSAQQVLDNLASNFRDAAFHEDGLTASTHAMRNSFGQFKDAIGQFTIPALTALLQFFTSLINKWQSFASIISANVLTIGAAFGGLAEAIKKAMTLDFNGAKQALKQIPIEIGYVQQALAQQEEELEQKVTASTIKHSQSRIEVSRNETAEEMRLREESTNKALQMEAELDQKIQQLGYQSYQKKLDALAFEVEARRAAINREKLLEVDKQKVFAELAKYEHATKLQLAKDEVFLKQQAAFQIASLAVQTLQTVNSIGEKGSNSERIRAKALLALQQSIAIGWVWVAAMKDAASKPGGVALAAGLAAANTALIIAQFAQQSRAIDQAASRESQGISGININAPVPGIDIGAGSPGVGSPGSSTGGGGGVGISGGGSGGGGGATVIINVGGIYNSFNIDELALDNVDLVMVRINERLRQNVVEAVQMALQLKKTADRNSSLAS